MLKLLPLTLLLIVQYDTCGGNNCLPFKMLYKIPFERKLVPFQNLVPQHMITWTEVTSSALGQTFFILWFADISGLYSMLGIGIKIKIKFQ